MSDIKKLLGYRIKEIRLSKKLTQNKLAELVAVEETSISNIETGRYYPAPETLEKISKALEVPISSLYTFEHLKTPPLEVMITEVQKAMSESEDIAYKLYMTYKNLNY